MMQAEGVTRFDLQFSQVEPVYPQVPRMLNAWRKILWQLGLIGRDPARYGGNGFGNISRRLEPYEAPVNQRRFIISGTQTGHLPDLDLSHYAIVNEYNLEENRVSAEGLIRPSSESLTHGMIYNMDTGIRAVLHVHCPDIWNCVDVEGLPLTDAHAAYGTPAMAQEVQRLFEETDVMRRKILVMGGHLDGVVAFGETAEEAGVHLLHTLALSYAIE